VLTWSRAWLRRRSARRSTLRTTSRKRRIEIRRKNQWAFKWWSSVGVVWCCLRERWMSALGIIRGNNSSCRSLGVILNRTNSLKKTLASRSSVVITNSNCCKWVGSQCISVMIEHAYLVLLVLSRTEC
jgi:hypothetical protein